MSRRAERWSGRETELAGIQFLADGSVQDDLFGQVETELTRRAEATRLRAEFDARTRRMPQGTPVLWTAPYDAPSARQGEAVPGWRCWLCGEVVATEYVLGLVHGLRVDDPDVLTRAVCDRQTPTSANTPVEGDVR